MDGTLYDCAPVIESSYRRAVDRFNSATGKNLPYPSIDRITDNLGKTEVDYYCGIHPEIIVSDIPMMSAFSDEELCTDVRNGNGILYQGVDDLLSSLCRHGWKVVIASNGLKGYLSAIIETYSLSKYLAADVIVVNSKEIKTKGDILNKYRDLIKPEIFVMVGDRRSDVVAGREAGAFIIGCDFGHAQHGEIADADSIVQSLHDVKNVVDSLSTESVLPQN